MQAIRPGVKIVYDKDEFVVRSIDDDNPGLLCLSFHPEHNFASWCIDSKTQPPQTEPDGLHPRFQPIGPGESIDYLTPITPEELIEAIENFDIALHTLAMIGQAVVMNAQQATMGKGSWTAVAAGAMLADKTAEVVVERWQDEQPEAAS
jgi:hypothetical protein